MLRAVPVRKICPLCYEHHSEMTLRKVTASQDGMAYACQEPNCFIHYSRLDGYFLNTQDRRLIDKSPIPPHQYCAVDGFPLYLLEVQPKTSQFSPLELSKVRDELWWRPA